MTEAPVSSLLLPESVRGLKKLDKQTLQLFEKTVKVPYLKINANRLPQVIRQLRIYLLKVDHIKPIQDAMHGNKDILLNPDVVTGFDSFLLKDREALKEVDAGFAWKDIILGYGNWRIEQVLRAILPLGQEGFSSYTRVGHIVHVNLRDELLDYKYVIGKVLLDKLKGVTTVVNKDASISNTFRTFNVELLAGEDNMEAKVKENSCTFDLDFSKVYWNSRLSTEHERIVARLKHGSVVYDVFAGVGPFSIPAAKRKCTVFANDLNPEAYKWLQHNVLLNKVQQFVNCSNLDGRHFLQTTVKNDLMSRWREAVVTRTVAHIHIIMNLPAIAPDFLDCFIGMFGYSKEFSTSPITCSLPIVHCYCFSNTTDKSVVTNMIIDKLQNRIDADQIDVFHVRNVAPNKEMMRATFQISRPVLFEPADVPCEPPMKRPCLED